MGTTVAATWGASIYDSSIIELGKQKRENELLKAEEAPSSFLEEEAAVEFPLKMDAEISGSGESHVRGVSMMPSELDDGVGIVVQDATVFVLIITRMVSAAPCAAGCVARFRES